MTTEQLSRLLQVLRKCGAEQILFTLRQGIEVPLVTFDRIEEIIADITDIGLDSVYVSCIPERRTPWRSSVT